MKSGQNITEEEIKYFSDRLDGPVIIAIKSGNAADSENRINNQELDWHHHCRGKIFCIESGLVHVSTPNGLWVLPSNRAGWIQLNISHKIHKWYCEGWVIFILLTMCQDLPKSSRVIPMSEVLRALALRATEWGKHDNLSLEQEHILPKIICNEIRLAPEEPLHLPIPKSDRVTSR